MKIEEIKERLDSVQILKDGVVRLSEPEVFFEVRALLILQFTGSPEAAVLKLLAEVEPEADVQNLRRLKGVVNAIVTTQKNR